MAVEGEQVVITARSALVQRGLEVGEITDVHGVKYAGLVDELHLMVGPVIVGAGTPLFDGQPAVSLRLIDIRTWDGSNNVLVRYEVRLKDDWRE